MKLYLRTKLIIVASSFAISISTCATNIISPYSAFVQWRAAVRDNSVLRQEYMQLKTNRQLDLAFLKTYRASFEKKKETQTNFIKTLIPTTTFIAILGFVGYKYFKK